MTPRRKASARKRAVDQDEKPVSKPKTQAKGSQWGVASGLFKDAFEEIIVEIVALSHYCTNSYRVYKQNATQTDHKIKELTRNYSELAQFKEKQIRQAEEQIRQNKNNKDASVLDGVKEWYDKMTG